MNTRKPYRRSIGTKLRFDILESDGFACRYCGARAPDVQLQIDHVAPVARGGSDDPDNLVACCQRCNAGKGDRDLSRALTVTIADPETLGCLKDLVADNHETDEVGEISLAILRWWEYLEDAREAEAQCLREQGRLPKGAIH